MRVLLLCLFFFFLNRDLKIMCPTLQSTEGFQLPWALVGAERILHLAELRPLSGPESKYL